MTELDSQNSAPAAECAPASPVADAPTPRAAAEAKKAAAAKEAAAAFIQSANDGYGAVDAAQPRDVKKGHRTAVVAGLAICLLVVTAVLTYLFISGFFNAEPAPEQTQRIPLSDARVIAAFDEVSMDAPDISRYAYVPQDALIGPKFSDIVLNEPANLGAAGNQIVTCEATATATFKNKGIEIDVPVTLPFDYSDAGETWVPGELVVGEATAVPLASANVNDILANLNDILIANDPTYGEAMVDASVVKTTSDLTIDGGPVAVDLSKTTESEADGVKTSELRTSSVTLSVAWSNTEGWLVTVAEAGQIETQANRIPVNPAGDSPASVDPVSTEPENIGNVKFGDSVSLSGTLQAVEGAEALAAGNNYSNAGATDDANGSVQLVLKLNRPLDMNLNGIQYRLATIAVATSGLDDNGASLVGRKADVKGPLEESFATSWSPAGVKAFEIHVE